MDILVEPVMEDKLVIDSVSYVYKISVDGDTMLAVKDADISLVTKDSLQVDTNRGIFRGLWGDIRIFGIKRWDDYLEFSIIAQEYDRFAWVSTYKYLKQRVCTQCSV